MRHIVVSKSDLAGMNMFDVFQKEHGFEETDEEYRNNRVWDNGTVKLVVIEKYQVYADYLDELNAELIVFASKHSSAAGKPALTVHSIGNFGEDVKYGGKPSHLCPTNASVAKEALQELMNQKKLVGLEDFDVSLEATHHGPLLKTPSVWVELGSDETGWKNKQGAQAICNAIMKSITVDKPYKTAIGLGGQHYPGKFTKLALDDEWAFGHMCPKYALPSLTMDLLEQMLFNSGKVEQVFLEWKALGPSKAKVLKLLEDRGLSFERV